MSSSQISICLCLRGLEAFFYCCSCLWNLCGRSLGLEEKKKRLLKKKREGPRELIMWGLDGGKEKRNILH